MQEIDTSSLSRSAVEALLAPRSDESSIEVETTVRTILQDVRKRGDDALVDYTRRFDWPDATAAALAIPEADVDAAESRANPAPMEAAREAAANIAAFHTAELGHLQSWMTIQDGGRTLGQMLRPVRRVGLYVPGGKAFYPSTVLMTAIPAVIAGVDEIVLCTPAGKDGSVHPMILAVAAPYVDRIYRVGGAQAIAAMAYGTETIPKVDVIVGPGNQYVNVAKKMVYGDAGIDMLAGPSEIAIVADEHATPAFVAADLLAQTEHGPENRGILFSPSKNLLAAVREELAKQRESLSRSEILEKTDQNLLFVATRSIEEAVELSNIVAPEHLELHVQEPLALLSLVRNAGAVLLGEHTSAPVGDYIAGPSHTLPTAGTARFSSPLSVSTFMKRSSVVYYSAAAAAAAADKVAMFAMVEGFDAHARAAQLRGASTPESNGAAE